MDKYPWNLNVAESRGWPREAHRVALATGNEDLIAMTHPTNWLTEAEVEATYESKCILCYLPAPAEGPDIDGKRCHEYCYREYLMDNIPHDTSVGYGPHNWGCVPCSLEADKRREYREDPDNNPHRKGSKRAANWVRDRARLDWAMDLRGETYWSM